MQPKYPAVTVKLTNQDGNAFAVLALAVKALKKGGVSQAEIDTFYAEATSGDYDQLLQTIMRWMNVS